VIPAKWKGRNINKTLRRRRRKKNSPDIMLTILISEKKIWIL